jgi:hypothetical protein
MGYPNLYLGREAAVETASNREHYFRDNDPMLQWKDPAYQLLGTFGLADVARNRSKGQEKIKGGEPG